MYTIPSSYSHKSALQFEFLHYVGSSEFCCFEVLNRFEGLSLINKKLDERTYSALREAAYHLNCYINSSMQKGDISH